MKIRISDNLMIGKAGEHLACCDLICQGFNAFLSDQGLPFDLVVEHKGKLYRGQVKTVQRMYKYYQRKDGHKANRAFRFTTRHGTTTKNRATELNEVDFYAFVVLPKKIVAYMWVKDMVSKNTGKVNQLLEFKDRDIEYKKDRLGRKIKGKFIQDYLIWKPNKSVKIK